MEKNKLEKSRVCILIFLFILIFSGTSSMLCKAQHKAYLPTGVPKTGVSKSYHSGDDGDLRRGIKWPNPRFIDNHNGIITDKLTGLMWERLPSRRMTNWFDAFKRVDKLNKKKLGGYSDWRFPNINELISIAPFGNNPAFRRLRMKGYMGQIKKSCYFLSSTTENSQVENRSFSLKNVLAVYLYYARFTQVDKNEKAEYMGPKTAPYYVIAVRTAGNGVIRLPKTGQITSYHRGDDGDLRVGGCV